jgi:autotransporter-associated beta strand protein
MTTNSSRQTGIGVLTVSNGSVTVNSLLNMAVNEQTLGLYTQRVNGTINQYGGAITVATGITMGHHTAVSPDTGLSTAIINLLGGSFAVAGDITNGVGNTASTLTLNGGTLDLAGNRIGSAATSVGVIWQAGTLRNLAELNNGANLVKTTTNKLTLDGIHAYSGSTLVSNGTVLVQGTLGGLGSVLVSSNATLGGTGTISGPVLSAGAVSPGASPGRLNLLRDYTQDTNGTLAIEIAGAADYDVLAVGSNAVLSGTLTVTTNGYAPVLGNAFTVLTASALSGTFAATNLPALPLPLLWTVSYSGTSVVLGVLGGTSSIGVSGSLDFGDVVTGATAQAAMAITNSGTIAFAVTNIIYPAGFSGAWTGSVSPGSASNVTVTFAPLTAGSFGGMIDVQSDADGGSGLIACSGTGVVILTGYDLYALAITNPAERSYQSDPDGDGDENLYEYSQGTDPTNGASNLKLQFLRGTNGVHYLKFNRVTGAVDVVYQVEAAYSASNNAAWSGIASNALGIGWDGDASVTETNSGPVVQVFAEDNDPFATNRNMRLRVTRP